MIEDPGTDPANTNADPDPEEQHAEPRPGSAQDEREADDFEHDPARNPEDPNLEDLKGA